MENRLVGLQLGMEILGIPLEEKHYRDICDAVYLAKKMGVYLAFARVEMHPQLGRPWSPKSHEYSGSPAWCLLDDVREAETEIAQGLPPTDGYVIDEKPVVEKLLRLKEVLSRGGSFQEKLERLAEEGVAA